MTEEPASPVSVGANAAALGLSLRCERSRGRRTRERVVGGAHAS